MSCIDSGLREEQKELPPDNFLKGAVVKLSGLSYGEYDGGKQRRQTSEQVWKIARYWASGLMEVEQPNAVVERTRVELFKLVNHEIATTTLDWGELENDGELFENCLTKCAKRGSSLIEYDSLRVCLSLMAHRKTSTDSSNIAASVPHLLFTCVQLQGSNADEQVKRSCDEMFKLICETRRISSTHRLLSEYMTSICSFCKRVLADEDEGSRHFQNEQDMDQVQFNIISGLHFAVHVAVDAEHGRGEGRSGKPLNQQAVDSILDVITDALGDSRTERRVAALHVLSLLVSNEDRQLLIRDRAAKELLSMHLPSSLLWVDEESVSLAIPMMISLSSRYDSDVHEWEVAMKSILKTAGFFVEKVLKEKDKNVKGIETSSTLLSLISTMPTFPLLPHMSNVLTLLTNLFSTASRHAQPPVVRQLSKTICHCLSISWPLFSIASHSPDSFGQLQTRRLYTASITAIIQSHRRDRKKHQSVVDECAKNIILLLHHVNRSQTENLIALTERRASKYPSLSMVGNFICTVLRKPLSEQQRQVSSLQGSAGKENPNRFGPAIEQFFFNQSE